MIFKNINSEDISGLIICSEPPISSSAIRTKETTIDGRDGAIVEKLGYKTRIRNVEIGLKKDANVDKILSYFSGEGDLIFKNENDKVYKAAIYEQVDLERLLRLRKGSVAFYCQPFKYKRNDIFETIKDNKVKEKKGEYLELLNCAEQNVVDLKLEGSTSQVTRSEKNKLPYNYYDGNSKTTNGITFTVNKGRSITANGTATANAQFSITNPDNYAIVAGSYKLVGENNAYTKKAIRGSYKKADGTIRYISSDSSFTIPEGATNVHLYLVILQGETVNNITFYPMLLNSTETDLTFEAGGASPSPDYPSPIKNIEGKNKFNIDQEKEIFGIMLYKYSYYLKPNTKYTISSNCPASTTANIYANSNSSNSAVYINKNQTIQSDENGYFYILVRFKADASDNSTFNLYEKVLNGTYYIQLEEGTVATPYVPDNSLEIKSVGENLLDLSKCQFNNCKLGSDGKSIISNISNNYYCELLTTQLNDYLLANKGKTLTFLTGTLLNKATAVVIYGTRTNGSTYQEVNEQSTGKCSITVADDFTTITAVRLRFNRQSTLFTDTSTTINYAMLVLGTEEIPHKPYQEQKVDFPLSEGQKLYEGSYLADDGIHHLRKQVVFDGSDDENWKFSTNKTHTFIARLPSISKTGICSHYKRITLPSVFDVDTGIYLQTSNSAIISDPRFSTIEEFKSWLSENPITVEYELSEEEIVPYTTAQQEAYNQLQKLKLYKGQNTMFSLEGSIINLKYLEDTDEKVENQGNIYSKPIIRLEKTVFKEVEIAINGIRFKYNFEEDDYVEIDCEEMTVQYEGLDRNRRLVIDFEFPKLKEGNNDIVMYSGDCIIKCKRKDRWL